MKGRVPIAFFFGFSMVPSGPNLRAMFKSMILTWPSVVNSTFSGFKSLVIRKGSQRFNLCTILKRLCISSNATISSAA